MSENQLYHEFEEAKLAYLSLASNKMNKQFTRLPPIFQVKPPLQITKKKLDSQ